MSRLGLSCLPLSHKKDTELSVLLTKALSFFSQRNEYQGFVLTIRCQGITISLRSKAHPVFYKTSCPLR